MFYLIVGSAAVIFITGWVFGFLVGLTFGFIIRFGAAMFNWWM